ncbi:sporulation integral membrane protein YlbJ [Paenibacillus uliginis]|nr:sporulation integral membrane protein YlbJ [Paenibacillus uliginis]
MTMKRMGWIFLMTGLFSIVVLMAAFPGAALQSAIRGLSIWWDVLFPSLFPFFVISEVLLGFGVVHLIGTLLDPLMKPLFRIPGSGGFVAAMGYVSGYPVGAKLTAKLWEQKMVNRDEGERLVAFTTSSDPIFLIGAVSIGFFHNPQIGLILALAHYGGGFLVGLLMRFHGRKNNTVSDHSTDLAKGSRLKVAIHAMHHAREADGRDFGTLLRQAVQSSLQLIIVVGGLVVFFSVFLELWTRAGAIPALNQIVSALLSLVGVPEQLSTALVGGLFEVTLGARYAGEAGDVIPLAYKAAVAAFILSWGGLSVHAQIASILNATDLRYLPFMIARLIHGVVAATAVLLFWNPIMGETITTQAISAVSYLSSSGYNHIMAVFCILLGILISLTLLMEVFILLRRKFRNFPR